MTSPARDYSAEAGDLVWSPVGHSRIMLAELLSALSTALDMTEGQPIGHCVRSCWIGVNLGRKLGLSSKQLGELYYVLLLKDVGCSSNAARICQLYLTDDLKFKHDVKLMNGSLPQALRFVVSHTGIGSDFASRLGTLVNVMRNGGEIANELIETRCQRGADIALRMRFPEAVADGIRCLDEHWDGGGEPNGLTGEDIPLYARIALLAQLVDVFHTSGGRDAACKELELRSGGWLDPSLVTGFRELADTKAFWTGLASESLVESVYRLEPARHAIVIDEDYLDDIAAAFAMVIDSKSPYTNGHSQRVAGYADLLAEEMGLTPEHRRWLRRVALLHDIGKLGVSNRVLDKEGPLDDTERNEIEMHAAHSETILMRIDAFRDLAPIAGAHHERIDGGGYPKGLKGAQIKPETRILSVADVFDALTDDRPYRKAMPFEKAASILNDMAGPALDPECVGAFLQCIGKDWKRAVAA